MKAQQDPIAPPQESDPPRKRVGLVDDDPVMLSALRDLIASTPDLELAGTASDARGARLLAEDSPLDVILMDVRMPGGGQRATMDVLKTSPSTKVVAFTAQEDRETVLEMVRAGAVGYVGKGSSSDAILDAIRRAAAGKTALSPEASRGVMEELASRLREQHADERERTQRLERIEALLTQPERLQIALQAIVDLRTEQVVGMEALSRFEGPPDRPPNEWFDEAWRMGLGPELELLALANALELMPHLPAGAYLSLNLSPAVAIDRRVPGMLQGTPPDRIVIEVTEHTRIADYEEFSRALRGLRSAGLRIAEDDAGAGYAGLRDILQLAPDIIKLDTELTRGIETDRPRRALATAMISFAREIGSTIVAEGIETQRELDALKVLGVQYGQGFYLGRPTVMRLAGSEVISTSGPR
ncbi:MAG: EAL domain-containing protein [Actinomycetota bacterium]|nr:EAL domain-containing protein [Actinomycetota bacterium]